MHSRQSPHQGLGADQSKSPCSIVKEQERGFGSAFGLTRTYDFGIVRQLVGIRQP